MESWLLYLSAYDYQNPVIRKDYFSAMEKMVASLQNGRKTSKENY